MIDPTDVDYIRTQLTDMANSELASGKLSEAGADLIRQVAQAPNASDDDGLAVSRFVMPQHGGVALKRLFVITGPGGQHILYVPTQPASPGDRIFYENHDLHRTSAKLVEFLGKPDGLQYMVDLLPNDNSESAAAYFEELSRLPSQFTQGAFALGQVSGDSYAHQIQVIVNR